MIASVPGDEAAVAHPGLALATVFKHALEVAGPDRLLFGTDSSFYPRGWNKAVYEAQVNALDLAGVDQGVKARILGSNFDRLFPLPVLS